MTRPRIPEDSRIALRWARWEPFCILHLHRSPIRSYSVTQFRAQHTLRWTYCREQGLPHTTIASADLDNPMSPVEKFQHDVECAVERRFSRMGRVKGQSIRHLSLEERRAKFIAEVEAARRNTENTADRRRLSDQELILKHTEFTAS